MPVAEVATYHFVHKSAVLGLILLLSLSSAAAHPMLMPRAEATPSNSVQKSAVVGLILLLSLSSVAAHPVLLPNEEVTPSNLFQKSAVIGVMSSKDNLGMRMLVRDSYKHHMVHPIRISVAFVIGTYGETQETKVGLEFENKVYNDLALLPRTEDVAESPELVYWGHAFHWGRHTYNFPEQTFVFDSWYCSGGFYLLSRDLVEWIAANQKKLLKATMFDPFEDKMTGIWVGIAMSQAPTSEWYNLDVSAHGEWYYEEKKPDTSEFNDDAQDGKPPLSTIAIHSLELWRFMEMHYYFVRDSYYQWHACIHLRFESKLCMQMLQGGTYERLWSKKPFLLTLHDELESP
eukprot:gene25061-10713_t